MIYRVSDALLSRLARSERPPERPAAAASSERRVAAVLLALAWTLGG